MLQQLSRWGGQLSTFFNERVDFGVQSDSPTLSTLNRYFERYSLSTLLPYRTFDPAKGLFYNDESVGFIFETYPLVGCSEEMQREISGLFQHTLPEGSNLQFLLWADPDVGGLTQAWQEPRVHHGDVFERLAQGRIAHLKSVAARNYRCIISYTQTGDGNNPVEEERLLQLKEQIKTALKSLGMPLWEWQAADLLTFLDGLLNGPGRGNLHWNPFDSLDLQVPTNSSGVRVYPDHLRFDAGKEGKEKETRTIRTYGLRREPDRWSLHAMRDLIGDPLRDLLQIPCPFLIHYGIHVCDQEKTKLRVQSRESWVENQARSKIGKRIPILQRQARELDFVRHQQGKGERFVQTSFGVSLFSCPEQLPQADQILLSLFRSKRWQLEADPYIQLPLLLAMLPLAWGEGWYRDLYFLQRLKTTLSTEAANLLPLQGEWKGTASPGMLFVAPCGQLFTWSPFDNQEGNYNVVVVGKSGSGKSVFMQELVTSNLGQGGKSFILDVGRSFEKTVKLLKGTYLEFTPHSGMCINPFTSLPHDNAKEVEDALAMLKPILSLMAAPKEGTGDLENAYLEQGLKWAWETKHHSATITDVAHYLTHHRDTIAQGLGQKLFPYTKDGMYGRFFEGPATVDLSASLVVVELEELKERKDLQEVIVQMIILQITNQLYLGDRKTPAQVVLDEAWDMLRGKQSGIFIETAARRLRKYRGSLVVGTQSINDFYATPAAQAAFDNADWMCLLAQKPESIRQLKESKRIIMDPAMELQLTSLKTKQGHYAEILIHGPHGYAVGRLYLDPFSRVLYSTKAEEFAAVQEHLQKGMPLADAIGAVAEGSTP